jgi:hypothetical protein
VEKMHTKNRAGTDPITKKNEEERLGEIWDKEIADEFIQNDDRTDVYLNRFGSKYRITNESCLLKYRRITNKFGDYAIGTSFPSIFQKNLFLQNWSERNEMKRKLIRKLRT